MGSVGDGRVIGGLIQEAIQGFMGGDAGATSVPHHLQCGGECSGLALGRGDGRVIGRAGRVCTGGQTPKRPLIRR